MSDPEDALCLECGEHMFVTDDGVSHHFSSTGLENIDHEADANHVARAEEEE